MPLVESPARRPDTDTDTDTEVERLSVQFKAQVGRATRRLSRGLDRLKERRSFQPAED